MNQVYSQTRRASLSHFRAKSFACSVIWLALIILAVSPLHCYASQISGDMSVWDLFWWTGGSDYPSQWWHGLGPLVALFAVVVISIIVGWYLLRRLLMKS